MGRSQHPLIGVCRTGQWTFESGDANEVQPAEGELIVEVAKAQAIADTEGKRTMSADDDREASKPLPGPPSPARAP